LEFRKGIEEKIFKSRRSYEEYKRSELESLVGNPKKRWLKVASNNGQHATRSIMCMIKTGQ